MTNSASNDVMANEALTYRSALDGMRQSLKEMPEQEVERRVTVDASAAALIVGATVTKVEPFRAELIGAFGEAARQVLDALPVVALATRQADIELAMSGTMNDLSGLFEEVRATHQLLITDAASLANRKLLDPKRLEPARNVQGYLATVDSVERLVSLLRESWATLGGHTPLVEADLDRAVVLAKRLSAAVAARDNGVARAPALETRLRVISRLLRLYDELRRMMTYLRWRQGDVDLFAPSLWASRGRRSRAQRGGDPNLADPTDDPTLDAGGPASPAVPTNGGGPFIS